ncbi:MAG: hypothetical protein ABTA24_08050 [Arthrobacter sp.]
MAATTAACLLWAELPLSVSAGTSALLLAAFTAAWYGSRPSPVPAPTGTHATHAPQASTAMPAAPDAEPARDVPGQDAASPGDAVLTQDSPEGQVPGAVPAIPPAPGAAREFLSTPVPGPAGHASRWTRTFGPPDTGALPLQPYVPAAHSPVKTADSESPDRRQRSHSSL